jgi:hypothetical protein
MVSQAAESLEFVFRRRASVAVMAAGASVSLGVAASMVAPALRASTTTADVREAKSDSPTTQIALAHAPVNTPSETRYSVLSASFPLAEVTRAGSAEGARLNAVVGRLQALGYDVRVMDVDLGDGGEWRRVLAGEFSTEIDAAAQADRVRQMLASADAHVIHY